MAQRRPPRAPRPLADVLSSSKILSSRLTSKGACRQPCTLPRAFQRRSCARTCPRSKGRAVPRPVVGPKAGPDHRRVGAEPCEGSDDTIPSSLTLVDGALVAEDTDNLGGAHEAASLPTGGLLEALDLSAAAISITDFPRHVTCFCCPLGPCEPNYPAHWLGDWLLSPIVIARRKLVSALTRTDLKHYKLNSRTYVIQLQPTRFGTKARSEASGSFPLISNLKPRCAHHACTATYIPPTENRQQRDTRVCSRRLLRREQSSSIYNCSSYQL
jgi:hypothetical protein